VFAAKAASLELTNLREFLRLRRNGGLCLPLTLLVDYGGYRVVASCLLPISASTLVYGSADAGRTVHLDDATAAALMAAAGAALNIKPHVVGQGQVICGPADIEVHRSAGTAGGSPRYYVVDAARVLPPEAPPGSLSAFLVHADPPDSSPSPPPRGAKQAQPRRQDAAPKSRLTALDLSRENAEREIRTVLASMTTLGVDAVANVPLVGGDDDAGTAVVRIDVAGAAVYVRADANPHLAPDSSATHAELAATHERSSVVTDLASLGLLFGRNTVAEAFVTPLGQDQRNRGFRILGDAVIVAGERGQHLYSCLRPELVRDSPNSLSSDAFTRFGLHDAEIHNNEVRAATKSLTVDRLPKLAKRLRLAQVRMHWRGCQCALSACIHSLEKRARRIKPPIGDPFYPCRHYRNLTPSPNICT
jgi:hypothetical protein